MAEPDAKKLKTGKEDDDKAADVEKKEPELPVEHEKDAPTAKVPTIGKEHTVHFRTHDTTLNVLQGTTPGVLKTLSDGGLKFLLAGARASAAAKAGRYMFECRILEYVHPQDDHRQRHPGPTQVFRVGFSTASSCLVLGQDEQSISFDMDGTILYNKKKSPGGSKFVRDDYASVVLNLDSKSPNFQTISLFVNGVRASQPHPLPEKLKGVPLFPHVSFKNLTVHVNFGPTSCKSLPFTCKTIQELSTKDSVLSATPPELKDGKSEILFPVCLPDEGTFDWLDEFLRQHPHYVELSDRMIVEWATRSDVVLKKSDFKSNDKPEVSFNLHGLEDNSVRRLLNAVALLQPRHLVCMEVRRNLLKDERTKLLDAFPSSCFVRIAKVVMGEPHSDFVKLTHAKMLQAKQEKADIAFKQQKQEEQRKKLLAKRQKEVEKQKKKIERERKKAEKEKQKKLEAEKKAKEEADKKTQADGEGGEDKKEDKAEEEPQKMDEDDEEEDEEPEEEEEDDGEDNEEPPKVELDAEEKKIKFRSKNISDLTAYVLSTSFAAFTVPEKDEGFDQISYAWSKSEAVSKYLREWILHKKNTTRIEDLKPSDWFNNEFTRWQKQVQAWHGSQNAHKTALAKKEAEKQRKAAAKAIKEKKKAAEEAAKAAKEAVEKEKKEKEGDEGDEKKDDEDKADEANKGETPKPVEEEEEKEEEVEESEQEEDTVDFDNLDIFGLEDVSDIGDKSPLFKEFQAEDWAMLGLRFELHLLSHAFTKDANDPDRKGVHLDHLAFYYQKYFKKMLNLKFYGLEANTELVALIEDTIRLKGKILESRLPESLESHGVFVKITEEARRDRNRLIDLGEESARLKIQSSLPPAVHHHHAGNKGKGGCAGDKGKGGGCSFGGGGKFGGKEHSKDYGGKDYGGKDYGGKDYGGKDYGGKDYGGKDYGGKDYGGKDYGGKDYGKACGKSAGGWNSGGWNTGGWGKGGKAQDSRPGPYNQYGKKGGKQPFAKGKW